MSTAAAATTTTNIPPKTAVVMLNMGGPNDLDEVGPFLHNLFSDGEIITLGPLQNILGRFLLGPPSSSFVLPHSTSHHTPLLTFIA